MNYTPLKHAMRFLFGALLLVAFAGMVSSDRALAQRAPGALGIGGQIGEPSGLSLKIYHPNTMSWDFLAAWDLDDFFYLNVHGVFESHPSNTPEFHFFYGPGGFIGLRDRPRDDDDDVEAGISGTFGIGFMFDRVEVYGRITPRLSVTPDTDGDVGGGIGLRFYL